VPKENRDYRSRTINFVASNSTKTQSFGRPAISFPGLSAWRANCYHRKASM